MQFEGAVFERGDAQYEAARRAAAWNERKPERYPELIVKAAGVTDVQSAVLLAADRELKVKARAGGHSWTASSIRSGLLVDLSGLAEVSFDPQSGLASVQPGVKGRDLNMLLAGHGLFFPSGHCPTVGLGGFLLQGGWGWNSRSLGPACMNIVGVDVVTAEGELIHADEDHNSDYLWAARGAGAGYFGIVTRFVLKVHPRPTGTYTRTDVYSLDDMDAVLRWALEFEPTVEPEFEFAIMATTPTLPDGRTVLNETALMVMCQALMYDDGQAHDALRRMDECPAYSNAVHREDPRKVSFVELYDGPDSVEPEGVRWAADGMWTNAKGDDLLEPVKALIRDVPTPESHIFWYPWRQQDFGDAAISVQGDLYLAGFAGWHDPADDEHYQSWITNHMKHLEHLSEGIQLADENLANRSARYLSEHNSDQLERLRAKHDPERRFHSYLTVEGDRVAEDVI